MVPLQISRGFLGLLVLLRFSGLPCFVSGAFAFGIGGRHETIQGYLPIVTSRPVFSRC